MNQNLNIIILLLETVIKLLKAGSTTADSAINSLVATIGAETTTAPTKGTVYEVPYPKPQKRKKQKGQGKIHKAHCKACGKLYQKENSAYDYHIVSSCESFKRGDKVLVPPHAGVAATIRGNAFIIMPEDEVMVRIHEAE